MKTAYIKGPWKIWPRSKEVIDIHGDVTVKDGTIWEGYILATLPDYDFDTNGRIPQGIQKGTACILASAPEMVEIVKDLANATSNDLPYLKVLAKEVMRRIKADEKRLRDLYPIILKKEEKER